MGESPSTRPSLLVRLRDPQDERAWAEFLEIYTPLVHRLARQKGLQEADADDLVQDVFRAVVGAIGRWDPDPKRGTFRGWLSRIARNLIVDLLAARCRHPQGTGDTGVGQWLEEHPAPSPDDSALFEEEYRRRLFQWAIEQVRGDVHETTWQAFWRAGVQAEDPGTVAQALGVNVGTVYVSKNRVMARIRRKIEEFEGR